MKDEAREYFKEILEHVKAREIEKYGRVLKKRQECYFVWRQWHWQDSPGIRLL